MPDRPHLSIGEVLTLLRDEFPDITVSKIRFLESQGLIVPERTPSGYRKFYDPDLERLRWILRQQREHYLPLKVIKGRLGEFEQIPGSAEHADANGGAPAAPAAGEERAGELPLTGVSLSRSELLRSAGLDEARLAELESYGLLPGPRRVGQNEVYDEEALGIARLARGFFQHGVEARHLKMYKSAVEREVALYQQVVAPILKSKNPNAPRHAGETVAELTRLGQSLREAMLRLALSRSPGEPRAR